MPQARWVVHLSRSEPLSIVMKQYGFNVYGLHGTIKVNISVNDGAFYGCHC